MEPHDHSAQGINPLSSAVHYTGDPLSMSYTQVQDRLNHRLMQLIEDHEIMLVQLSLLVHDLEVRLETLEKRT